MTILTNPFNKRVDDIDVPAVRLSPKNFLPDEAFSFYKLPPNVPSLRVVTWKSKFLDQNKSEIIAANARGLVEHLCPHLTTYLVCNDGAAFLNTWVPYYRGSLAEQSDEDWQKGLAFPSS